ncbi:hypothetical protein BDV10DRAFT_189052 [Aspergillus recurvatus]
MEPILDCFGIMSYDLYGSWGRYYHTNLTEIDAAMELLWWTDIDRKKIVMQTGSSSHRFTLSVPACSNPGYGFSTGNNPGKYLVPAGCLMSFEIQEIIDAGGAKVVYGRKAGVQMVTWVMNQMVLYNGGEALEAKVGYANEICLSDGLGAWADDHKGNAIRALPKAAERTNLTVPVLAATANNDPSQCVWGECGAECPSGLIPVEELEQQGPAGDQARLQSRNPLLLLPVQKPTDLEMERQS